MRWLRGYPRGALWLTAGRAKRCRRRLRSVRPHLRACQAAAVAWHVERSPHFRSNPAQLARQHPRRRARSFVVLQLPWADPRSQPDRHPDAWQSHVQESHIARRASSPRPRAATHRRVIRATSVPRGTSRIVFEPCAPCLQTAPPLSASNGKRLRGASHISEPFPCVPLLPLKWNAGIFRSSTMCEPSMTTWPPPPPRPPFGPPNRTRLSRAMLLQPSPPRPPSTCSDGSVGHAPHRCSGFERPVCGLGRRICYASSLQEARALPVF